MIKILVTDPVSDESIQMLQEIGEVVLKPGLSEKALCEEIRDCDVLVVRSSTKVTRNVINSGKKLKLIARTGVGLDNIDVKAAEERGIKVVNSPEASSASVAEFVLGLMLCWVRHIPEAHFSLREGRWEKTKFMGKELKGKTLGIIGVGRIGGEVAVRGIALGMRVLGLSLIHI